MKLLLILTTLISLQVHAQAFLNEKGNGGDVYTCDGQIRFLDSAHMKNQKIYKNHQFKSTKEFNLVFLDRLLRTVPVLANDFMNFLTSFEKGKFRGEFVSGRGYRRMWISGIPKEYNDENLSVEDPEGCEDKQQIVYRKSEIRHKLGSEFAIIEYYVDEEKVKSLKENKDELSWLLVHEWLWGYLDDAEDIRLVNAYFHSEDFLDASEEEVIDELLIDNIDISVLAGASKIQEAVYMYLSIRDDLKVKLRDIEKIDVSDMDEEEVKYYKSQYYELNELANASVPLMHKGRRYSILNIFPGLGVIVNPYKKEAKQLHERLKKIRYFVERLNGHPNSIYIF